MFGIENGYALHAKCRYLFVPGIQVDTDADDHGHERIMFFGMYPHGMESVII